MSSPPPVLQYALPESRSDRKLAALKARNKYLLRIRLTLLVLIGLLFLYGLLCPERSAEREKIAIAMFIGCLAYCLICSIATSASVVGGFFIILAGLLIPIISIIPILNLFRGWVDQGADPCALIIVIILSATWKLIHLFTWPTPGMPDLKPNRMTRSDQNPNPSTPPAPFIQPDTSEDPHLTPPTKADP
jgi:hypothetical protein